LRYFLTPVFCEGRDPSQRIQQIRRLQDRSYGRGGLGAVVGSKRIEDDKYGNWYLVDRGLCGQLGQTILKTERAFNQSIGFTSQDERLPEFFEEEPIAPHNAVWDIDNATLDSFGDF